MLKTKCKTDFIRKITWKLQFFYKGWKLWIAGKILLADQLNGIFSWYFQHFLPFGSICSIRSCFISETCSPVERSSQQFSLVLDTFNSSFDTTILSYSAGDGGVLLVRFSVVAEQGSIHGGSPYTGLTCVLQTALSVGFTIIALLIQTALQ